MNMFKKGDRVLCWDKSDCVLEGEIVSCEGAADETGIPCYKVKALNRYYYPTEDCIELIEQKEETNEPE